MSAHDRYLAGHRVERGVEAWCSNVECRNHAGTRVSVETEYGQSWAVPEECECGGEWLWTAPDDEEDDDGD